MSTPGNDGPADVGSYPADESPFGARDLAGNVFDFVADPRPGGAAVRDGVVVVESPAVSATHRYRGGSYNAAPFFGRSDLRRWHPAGGSDQLGFRLARSLGSGG
jgi:formylglycine-generating enzyme required for sulfatase activity